MRCATVHGGSAAQRPSASSCTLRMQTLPGMAAGICPHYDGSEGLVAQPFRQALEVFVKDFRLNISVFSSLAALVVSFTAASACLKGSANI